MHLSSYFCVQVLVLLVCQLEFSCSVPIKPPTRIDLIIDPIHTSEQGGLDSKKVVPKSVLNVPYLNPPPAANRCPPGQTRLSGGPCVQRVTSSGLSDDQQFIADLTRDYFKRKAPPKRHRHPYRTTTQEPPTVPTTTGVTPVTEASTLQIKDATTVTTSEWATSSPSLFETTEKILNQDQALTEEILTSTPTPVTEKDVTTSESSSLEHTSLKHELEDLLSMGTALTSNIEENIQTTESPLTVISTINDKTTLNYGMETTDFPSEMPDIITFTQTTEVPVEIPRESTPNEEPDPPRTELPNRKEEESKEAPELTSSSAPIIISSSLGSETEREIPEESKTLDNVLSLASLNNSQDADVKETEKVLSSVEKVDPAVVEGLFTSTNTTPAPTEESEAMREETTTPVAISLGGDNRTMVAPVMERVEEFTSTAIYLSQPAQIPGLQYQPEVTFDFIPSPSDIYKPTMPPKYTPKISFPLEFSSSSTNSNIGNGRLVPGSQPSSFISYDFFSGDPRPFEVTHTNYNPSYAFS